MTSVYETEVLSGARRCLEGIARDARFGYSKWRKELVRSVAAGLPGACNLESLSGLVWDLLRQLGRLEASAQIRSTERRLKDVLRALESAGSRRTSLEP